MINKYQKYSEVRNWNGLTLGSNGIIYCDDCQDYKNTCQICGNCKCDGYPCKHQKKQKD